jgi:hypothetical protein
MTSASSVIQCWRELIAQADSTVLLDKRRGNPENLQYWRLKFINQTNQRGQSSVFEICQVGPPFTCSYPVISCSQTWEMLTNATSRSSIHLQRSLNLQALSSLRRLKLLLKMSLSFLIRHGSVPMIYLASLSPASLSMALAS